MRRATTDDLLAKIDAVVTGHELQHSREGGMLVNDGPLVFGGMDAPTFADALSERWGGPARWLPEDVGRGGRLTACIDFPEDGTVYVTDEFGIPVTGPVNISVRVDPERWPQP